MAPNRLLLIDLCWQALMAFTAWSSALILSFLIKNKQAFKNSYLVGQTLLSLAVLSMSVWLFPYLDLFQTSIGTLICLLWLTFTWSLFFKSLTSALSTFPHLFFVSTTTTGRRARYHRFLALFLSPIPLALKPLVHKDLLYGGRRFRWYWLWFLIAEIGILLTGLNSAALDKKLEWHLGIMLAFVYIMAHNAFTFNQVTCENWAMLKTLPVSAKKLWWSKFMLVFLPYGWLVLAAFVVLSLHGTIGWKWFQTMLLSLFIVVSILFIQNNFSLYSYPFSKWAQLWFHLYVITAGAFFTVLLFPPLAVVFLFYGYFAVFRVQRRFNQWETST